MNTSAAIQTLPEFLAAMPMGQAGDVIGAYYAAALAPLKAKIAAAKRSQVAH